MTLDRAEGQSPSLSIVVVPLRGGSSTARLLEALSQSQAAKACEIIVTGSTPGEPRAGVTWLATPEGTSVPAQRSLGAEQSKGDVVAFLEDTVSPQPGWCDAISTLHARYPNTQAIGGTLLLSGDLSPAALALVLLDAGRFLTTRATSEIAIALPGCNLSFKRAALARLGVLSGEPLREAEAIPALASESNECGSVRLESDMAVTCVSADDRGLRAGSRFQHGRLYAGNRSSALAESLFRALCAPLLPFVLVHRCWRTAVRSGVAPLSPVLTRALWLASAWSLGEAAGYLFGPGDSERHWR